MTTTLAEAVDSLPDLTPRQREVVILIVQGLTYLEIGEALNISEVMVKMHAARARDTLGCKTRLDVVRIVWGKLTVSPAYTYT